MSTPPPSAPRLSRLMFAFGSRADDVNSQMRAHWSFCAAPPLLASALASAAVARGATCMAQLTTTTTAAIRMGRDNSASRVDDVAYAYDAAFYDAAVQTAATDQRLARAVGADAFG